MKAYLTPAEAAKALHISVQSVHGRIRRGQIAALKIFGRWRIEHQAVAAHAPDPIPSTRVLTVDGLASHWQVSTEAVERLVRYGMLRADGNAITRRAVIRFVADHTTGDA